MTYELLPIAALGIAMFLGMVAAEKFVAITQRKFRFSLRSLMILTVLISIALTVAVTMFRN